MDGNDLLFTFYYSSVAAFRAFYAIGRIRMKVRTEEKTAVKVALE
jgi:hypothetical protein